RNDQILSIPLQDVRENERFLVRPGDRIPLDGVVIQGSSYVNEAAITGESVPVAKRKGNSVYAGTTNQDGVLHISVTRPASDSTLARVKQIVDQAKSRQMP